MQLLDKRPQYDLQNTEQTRSPESGNPSDFWSAGVQSLQSSPGGPVLQYLQTEQNETTAHKLSQGGIAMGKRILPKLQDVKNNWPITPETHGRFLQHLSGCLLLSLKERGILNDESWQQAEKRLTRDFR